MNEMIAKRLKIIDDTTHELRKLMDHMQDILETDADYQQVLEEAKKVKEETKDKSSRVKEKPSFKAINDEIKLKRQELKELKEILSQELLEYYKESGELEIEDVDGKMKKMVFTVKLIEE